MEPPQPPGNNPHRENELRRGQAASRFESGPQSVRAARIETHARRARSPEPVSKQVTKQFMIDVHDVYASPWDDFIYPKMPGGDRHRSTNEVGRMYSPYWHPNPVPNWQSYGHGPLVNDLPRPRPPSPGFEPEGVKYLEGTDPVLSQWEPLHWRDMDVDYYREYNEWPDKVKPTVPLNFNPFS